MVHREDSHGNVLCMRNVTLQRRDLASVGVEVDMGQLNTLALSSSSRRITDQSRSVYSCLAVQVHRLSQKMIGGRFMREGRAVGLESINGLVAIQKDPVSGEANLLGSSNGNGKQLGVGDDDRGAGILELVGEFVGGVGRVDGGGDTSEQDGAEHGDGVIDLVEGEEGDDIAALEADGLETGSPATGGALPVAVGDDTLCEGVGEDGVRVWGVVWV